MNLLRAAALGGVLAALGAPVAAHAGGGGGGGGGGQPAAAQIEIKVKGLSGGKAKVGDRIEAIGTVRPFVGGQKVEIRLGNRGDTVLKKTPYVRRVKGKNFGRFHLRSKPLIEPGKYRIRVRKGATAAQAGASAKSKAFKLKFIDLDPGDSGPAVELLNDLRGRQSRPWIVPDSAVNNGRNILSGMQVREFKTGRIEVFPCEVLATRRHPVEDRDRRGGADFLYERVTGQACSSDMYQPPKEKPPCRPRSPRHGCGKPLSSSSTPPAATPSPTHTTPPPTW